jgi:DNA-directed RNA polymerase subunit RPC12/RpoP
VMNQATAQTVVAKSQTSALSCPRCGPESLQRVERVGFLEKHIYSTFGYFPWRCNHCQSRFYLKRRYRNQRNKGRSTG